MKDHTPTTTVVFGEGGGSEEAPRSTTSPLEGTDFDTLDLQGMQDWYIVSIYIV